MLFDHEGLRAVMTEICLQAGSEPDEAAIVADHLVEANLKGHDSHGVGMMPRYVGTLKSGILQTNQKLEVITDTPPILHVEGHQGFGHSIARQATDMAIERAKKNGAVIVSMRNANHIGRVGTYGERCAAAGLISVHFVNANGHVPRVAPFRGSDARMATNPICIAIPTSNPEEPFILDMATAAIAMGKVRVMKNKGEQVEPGLLVDNKGQPTTDPNVMFQSPIGALAAMGLHKGYGLSLVCELLAGALSGGGTMRPENQTKHTTCNNMLMIVIDPSRFADIAVLQEEVDAMLTYATASPAANPDEPVLFAGEPERVKRADRLANGIEVDDRTWEEILDAGEKVGLGRNRLMALANPTA